MLRDSGHLIKRFYEKVLPKKRQTGIALVENKNSLVSPPPDQNSRCLRETEGGGRERGLNTHADTYAQLHLSGMVAHLEEKTDHRRFAMSKDSPYIVVHKRDQSAVA